MVAKGEVVALAAICAWLRRETVARASKARQNTEYFCLGKYSVPKAKAKQEESAAEDGNNSQGRSSGGWGGRKRDND